MADVEAGELTDSDSDMTIAAPAALQLEKQPEQKSFLSYTAPQFQRTLPALPPSAGYRSTKGAVSSDESLSDSDEDSSLWKRQKQVNLTPKPEPLPFVLGYQRPAVPAVKKVNNVWGSVLQDQSQDAVATELGILEMDGQLDMSRQSESYNYILARKFMEKEKQQEGDEDMAVLDKELQDYMNDARNPVPKEREKELGHKEEENGHVHLKRKRPVKERLGERMEMNYKGRYELTEEDSEKKVANEIAFRLREPKKDLICRVVDIIGKKKAIEILMETAEVEQNGGLFIMNGTRRRTPGGVYINLLKSTPSVTGEQIKAIFRPENQKEYESSKAAKKRKRYLFGVKIKAAIKSIHLQEHDDASRETFASDTNEALASLDDMHDGHVEMKLDPDGHVEMKLDPDGHVEMKLDPDGPVEMKVDTEGHVEMKLDPEDAIEIDHTHGDDLETF